MNSGIMIVALLSAIGQVERAAGDATKKQRLDFVRQQMKDRWKSARAFVLVDDQEKEVARREQPILSYFEPTRDAGRLGSLWVWGTQGRPVALYVQANSPGNPVWGHELVALSKGVSAVMHDGWKWSPDTALQMHEFKESPRAADSDVARLIQMKAFARRFTITEFYQEQTFALRMQPRPIYRYQNKEAGLLDGCLFNFAIGTGPEAIAVIECRQVGDALEWSYGFLPLAGAAVTAKLDGNTVWSKKQTSSARAQEFYSVWLETARE